MSATLFFQGSEIAISSGTQNGVFATIQRATSISTAYQIPRTQTRVMGRFKPLNQQPVLNYTPVNVSVNYTVGNKDVPICWGIANTTGVLTQIGQNTEVANWGCRSFQIYNAPINSTNYAGQWNVTSGVLKSFSLAGSVGSVVEGSFTAECLDLQQVANNNARVIPNYSGQVVKSENMTFTGMDFTGLGYSGLTIQSFNFSMSVDQASTFRLGTKFPDRRITDGSATLQIVGYMEGVTNTVTSLNAYDCGNFITGVYVLSLQPSCISDGPLVVTMVNPYLMSQNVGTQVGSYTEVTLGFAIPLTTVAAEATGPGMGSNVTIT